MVNENILNLCKILAEKKAEKIVVYKTKQGAIVDFIVVCSATNYVQAKAIVDNTKERLQQTNLFEVCGAEGFNISNWHVLDLGTCFVHVLTTETRDRYTLDKLFSDGNNSISFERLQKKFEKQTELNKKKQTKLNNKKVKIK